MIILELSKVPMYGFHYDYIWKKYDNKSRLIFKYTGSLIYETETEKSMMILVLYNINLLSQNILMIQTS